MDRGMNRAIGKARRAIKSHGVVVDADHASLDHCPSKVSHRHRDLVQPMEL